MYNRSDGIENQYDLRFAKSFYQFDDASGNPTTLCIEVFTRDKEAYKEAPYEEGWQYDCMFTKYFGFELPDNQAYVDAFHFNCIYDYVMYMGWAEYLDDYTHGFVIYPLVEFTDEFLNEICEDADVFD